MSDTFSRGRFADSRPANFIVGRGDGAPLDTAAPPGTVAALGAVVALGPVEALAGTGELGAAVTLGAGSAVVPLVLGGVVDEGPPFSSSESKTTALRFLGMRGLSSFSSSSPFSEK